MKRLALGLLILAALFFARTKADAGQPCADAATELYKGMDLINGGWYASCRNAVVLGGNNPDARQTCEIAHDNYKKVIDGHLRGAK